MYNRSIRNAPGVCRHSWHRAAKIRGAFSVTGMSFVIHCSPFHHT